MQERRSSARDRVFMSGRIAYRDGAMALDCVVRNLTEAGAQLLVDEPSRAPCTFDLAIPPGAGGRRGRVVWRGERAIGVAFSGTAVHAPSSGSCEVVSIAEARAARRPAVVPDRLAERVAQVSRPAPRQRPTWAWPVRVR